MEIDIRLTQELTPAEYQQLFEWGEDIFGAQVESIQWRSEEWHGIVYLDGQPVSHVGLLKQDITVGDRPVTVGGVGGVVTVPAVQKQGYAGRALAFAADVLYSKLQVDFGLLFCAERLIPFYVQHGWQFVTNQVMFDQPGRREKVVSPLMRAMVLPCRQSDWPDGTMDLKSLPW